jgi:hypothetical protein
MHALENQRDDTVGAPGQLRDERQHLRRLAGVEQRLVGEEQGGGERHPAAALEHHTQLPGEQRGEVQYQRETAGREAHCEKKSRPSFHDCVS